MILQLYHQPRPVKRLAQRLGDKTLPALLQLLLCGVCVHLVLCPGDHPRVRTDGGRRNTRPQHQPAKTRKPAERHIYLSRSKRSAGIDNRLLKGQPLTLMDRNGPGQPDGILPECAQLFFFDGILLPVIGIPDILPGLLFQLNDSYSSGKVSVTRSSLIFLITPILPL